MKLLGSHYPALKLFAVIFIQTKISENNIGANSMKLA